ncbi:MAG TPA: response regulator [Noviherbaspirillum sp.]|uniref:GGDEF domain-containing response regulator n=1 Tax=Noviherbaspirillum sp. TaxID=1926288 RepID=UPI002DDD7119|nr:response regulator [Noviherbaspirillum sp.]HEV2610544.1 response regulator [Noviherbaspirillum sp.]
MTILSSTDLPAKPRVLIADDSRIVRASLIKHIEGMFDFREALDGEQAWETLLIDPSIRVVITDLTMPKLDGYGLLQRIRNSKISRIRSIPVVVVSGSDEREERDRAKAAGATDLITKGIGTAQLLSRLDILSKLVNTQHDFERSLESLARVNASDAALPVSSIDAVLQQANTMLETAFKNGKNFVILNVSVGFKHSNLEGAATVPPQSVIDAIGQVLQRTVRETDRVARTNEAEFTLITGSINFDSAHLFAERVCRAIAGANMVKDSPMALIASCGVGTLADHEGDRSVTAQFLLETARRRAAMGMAHAVTGVVGKDEEAALLNNTYRPPTANASSPENAAPATPDLATLLQWIKEGKREQVLPYIGTLSAELQPLVDLVLKKG